MLIFEYATMNAGKTAKLLQKDYDYNRIGKQTLLLKPGKDKRDSKIKSRNGFEKDCIIFNNIKELFQALKTEAEFIFIDEAQFLTDDEVELLRVMAETKTIFCYGLKNDFQAKLFEGSKKLLELADEINELSTFCHCGSKATQNLRHNGEYAIKSGEQLLTGKEDNYVAVCYKHYEEGLIKS
jgi:thymidine kinase